LLKCQPMNDAMVIQKWRSNHKEEDLGI